MKMKMQAKYAQIIDFVTTQQMLQKESKLNFFSHGICCIVNSACSSLSNAHHPQSRKSNFAESAVIFIFHKVYVLRFH